MAARLKAEAKRQHFFELEGAGGLGPFVQEKLLILEPHTSANTGAFPKLILFL
jgi:hypothetical protein